MLTRAKKIEAAAAELFQPFPPDAVGVRAVPFERLERLAIALALPEDPITDVRAQEHRDRVRDLQELDAALREERLP